MMHATGTETGHRDGFVEYERRSANGLIHQEWKDSDDASCHADGTPATGAIALCEVQAYVYAARRAGAKLAAAFERPKQAARLESQVSELRERFDEAFWCDDIETYALALDGDKRPCRLRLFLDFESQTCRSETRFWTFNSCGTTVMSACRS